MLPVHTRVRRARSALECHLGERGWRRWEVFRTSKPREGFLRKVSPAASMSIRHSVLFTLLRKPRPGMFGKVRTKL